MKQLPLPVEVRKSNALVRARWRTDTVYALRVIAMTAVKVTESDKDFKTYKIPAADIFQTETGHALGGWNYQRLRDLGDQITGTTVRIIDDPEAGEFDIVALFNRCRYSEKTGLFLVEFHPALKPHFLEFKKNLVQFTQYNLLEFLALPSIYAQRIFEILCSYRKTHPEVAFEIEDLQDRLAVPPSLRKNFKDFRMRVLAPSHKSITKKTSLEYEWEPVRKGRKVVGVRFIFSQKRAAPVARAKKAVTDQKRADGRNKLFKDALECRQRFSKSGSCSNDKGKLCETCATIPH